MAHLLGAGPAGLWSGAQRALSKELGRGEVSTLTHFESRRSRVGAVPQGPTGEEAGQLAYAYLTALYSIHWFPDGKPTLHSWNVAFIRGVKSLSYVGVYRCAWRESHSNDGLLRICAFVVLEDVGVWFSVLMMSLALESAGKGRGGIWKGRGTSSPLRPHLS